jgi:hypothetical protein
LVKKNGLKGELIEKYGEKYEYVAIEQNYA